MITGTGIHSLNTAELVFNMALRISDRNSLLLIVIAIVTIADLCMEVVIPEFSASANPSKSTIYTPPEGSTERSAILNAVRDALAIQDPMQLKFKVFHLKVSGPWAYFVGNEIITMGGREWRETDLAVNALLQKQNGEWSVREIWSLPTDKKMPLREFDKRVQKMRSHSQIPDGIFPPGHD